MAVINGTGNPDTLTGTGSADQIFGGTGVDNLGGLAGDDQLSGGDGGDLLDGGDGLDQLYSQAAPGQFSFPSATNAGLRPVLDTGVEVDTLYGGDDSDALFGGYGDSLFGGEDGLSGDTLSLSLLGATQGVQADFNGPNLSIGGGQIVGFENFGWIQGSQFDDTLVGAPGSGYGDFGIIEGMGGADRLTAAYYTGSLFGGAGDDVLDGLSSDHLSLVHGDAGDDVITVQGPNPWAYGDDGDDLIHASLYAFGGNGDDALDIDAYFTAGFLFGDAGNDVLTGDADTSSVLYGGDGADLVYGGEAADQLYFGSGQLAGDLQSTANDDLGLEQDALYGNGGDDVISVGAGDLAYGGAGDDLLISGGANLDGGGGADIASFIGAAAAVTADLALSGAQNTGGGGINTLISIEGLAGSRFNDLLYGDAGANVLEGGAGNDRLDGRGGLDTASYAGAPGAVTVSLAVSGAQATGGAGTDTLISIENLTGGAFNDILTGDGQANTIDGGFGDDRITGGAGIDTAAYASAANGVWVDLAISGAQETFNGRDTLIGIENLSGSDFGDLLQGDAGANILYGLEGDDSLSGRAGDDVVYGGAGDDGLSGDAGTNQLYGGDGIDTADYSQGGAVTVDLAAGTASGSASPTATIALADTLAGIENIIGSTKNDILRGDGGANGLDGDAGADRLEGRGGDDVISGGGGADIIDAGDGDDTILGEAGADIIDGGAGVDTAYFSGTLDSYTLTSSGGGLTVAGPDGTDTLNHVEWLQFDDELYHFRPGLGATPNFAASPSTYAGSLRDFDGNDLGGASSWVLAGQVDIQGDGDQEYVLFNQALGRWATIGPAEDGKVYFDDHGWAGDTRVVGIYIDPEVQAGHAAQGGPNDSQRRFQNDLNIGNLKGLLGAGDYDNDGFQEVYFSLTDGSAYLHAYMHADGNIRYANYQSQQQVIDYLTANGFDHTTWDGWF